MCFWVFCGCFWGAFKVVFVYCRVFSNGVFGVGKN